MLDLNIDAVFSVASSCDDDRGNTADSVASTTTSTTNNAEEVDCNSSTLNFSILHNNMIEIEEDDVRNELQLFPMGASLSPSAVRTKYWLNLSVPEVPGVELGSIHYKAQLPATNQVPQPQPQVKKSRRGPRSRSSQYRGVTFYRRTGRWESHIWFVPLSLHTHTHGVIDYTITCILHACVCMVL